MPRGSDLRRRLVSRPFHAKIRTRFVQTEAHFLADFDQSTAQLAADRLRHIHVDHALLAVVKKRLHPRFGKVDELIDDDKLRPGFIASLIEPTAAVAKTRRTPKALKPQMLAR